MGEPIPIPAKPEVVRVTPEMAADWLENRNLESNRRLSEQIALKYASEITDGRWMVTHQGIAFDREGFLIDGQHRLRAIVLADQAVELFVVPNCDAKTFAVLDSGFKRTAAHLVHAPHAQVIASAARYLYVVADDRRRLAGGVYTNKATTFETLEVVDAWPELVALAPVARSCYQTSKIAAATHLAVLAQAARSHHAGRIEDWAEGIRSGLFATSTDPRLALRNRWVREARFLNSGNGRTVAYRLIVRAWNAYVEGRQITKLQAAEESPAPPLTNR